LNNGALTGIDANALDDVYKKSGKEVGGVRVVASRDHKTLTVTQKGTSLPAEIQ
jgi:hypothetical protein